MLAGLLGSRTTLAVMLTALLLPPAKTESSNVRIVSTLSWRYLRPMNTPPSARYILPLTNFGSVLLLSSVLLSFLLGRRSPIICQAISRGSGSNQTRQGSNYCIQARPGNHLPITMHYRSTPTALYYTFCKGHSQL